MSALTGKASEDDNEPENVPTEGKLAQLKRQLREAELEGALTESRTTLLGISSTDCNKGTQLGPTVTTDVKVEGISTQVLLDTGSPATILLLLEVLWKTRPPNQTCEQWEK